MSWCGGRQCELATAQRAENEPPAHAVIGATLRHGARATSIAAAVALALSALLLGLNWLAAHTNADLVRGRVLAAFANGDLLPTNYLEGDTVRGANQINDCLTLVSILLRTGDAARDGLAPLVPQADSSRGGQPMCAQLRTLAELGPSASSQPGLKPYSRYWHGLAALTALLLNVLDLAELRCSLKSAFYALGACTVSIGLLRARRGTSGPDARAGIAAATMALCLLLFSGAPWFAQSLTHGYSDIAMLLLLACGCWWSLERVSLAGLAVLGAVCGTITIYLEYLNGPIPSVMVVLLVMVGFDAPNELNLAQRWARTVTAISAYVTAIGTSLAAKMLATIAVFGTAVLAEFIDALAVRVGNNKPVYALAADSRNFTLRDLFNSVSGNLEQIAWLFPHFGYFLVCLAGLELGYGAWWLWRRRARDAYAYAMMSALLASVVVPAWYLAFRNHTNIHAWFMVRLMAWPLATGWLAVLVVVLASRKQVRSAAASLAG